MTDAITPERLARLNPSLVSLDQIPLSGGAPTFPSETLVEKLQELFGLKRAKIEIETPRWLGQEEALAGVGEELTLMTLTCSPIAAPLFCAIAQSDLSKAMIQLLGSDQEAVSLIDPSLQNAFFHFLVAELLCALDEEEYPGNNLSLRIGNSLELPPEPALGIDLAVTLSRRKVRCRLLLPSPFHKEWCRHFAKRPPRRVASEVLRDLPLHLHLEIGETTLTSKEWKQVSAGDYIALERIDRKRVVITLEGQPLFGGKVTPEGVLLEPPPAMQEVTAAMDEEIEEQDDLSLSPEEEIDDEETWEEEDELTTSEPAPPLATGGIPLVVKVEIGQMVTTVDRLSRMEPGNVIELHRSLEQGVDLVVNGRRVGRGELMQVGDTLGVRVTEVG